MVRFLLGVSLAALVSTGAQAQYNSRYGGSGSGLGTGYGSNPSNTYVSPSIRSDGSYTGGHYRTTPNNTTLDNYGTRGNVNPYTGSQGTRSPRW